MIEVVPTPDHVVGLRVAGTITGEDMDRATAAIETALARYPRIGVFTDAIEWSGMTPEAFGKDLRYGLGKIGELGRFTRVAMVTDKEWLRAIARFEDRLLPRIDLRTFGSQEREAALAWVTEVPPGDAPPPALNIIRTDRDDTYGFEWDGSVSAEEMRALTEALEAAFAQHERIRVFGRIKHLGTVSPLALTHSGLFALKVQAYRKIDRYAVVGGPGWLKAYIRFVSSTLGLNLRHFEASEEDAAWAWLGARPLS
jgi:stage II sporulation SpoAA-like protein